MTYQVWVGLGVLLLGCSRDFSSPRLGSGLPDEAGGDGAFEFLTGLGCDAAETRGAELVLLPAGGLMIGAADLMDYTLPLVWTNFDEFCIDRTEVTLAQYRECVDAGACALPDIERWAGCNWDLAGREEHPVNCIDHARADAFCAWAGKRLPSEREWEYAARGSAARLYPWGPESPSAHLTNWNHLVGGTTEVGSYARGATPDTGVFDLAGNVWEWTASEWCESYAADAPCQPNNYVARGGSFESLSAEFLRPSWRDPISAGDDRFGLRCALGAGERR